MTDKDRDDKLESVVAEVVDISKESTKKIFLKGKHFGFDEGIEVAQAYINTIIFQEEAEYPLTKHDLISIFGRDDALDILAENDIRTIMVSIKEYKKNCLIRRQRVMNEFDKLLDSASKKASKSIKKIAKKARKLGFKEGLHTADDYINTIIFKENAYHPLRSEELDEIFGTDNFFAIMTKYNMDHIMEAIKRYKNSKETDTDE